MDESRRESAGVGERAASGRPGGPAYSARGARGGQDQSIGSEAP